MSAVELRTRAIEAKNMPGEEQARLKKREETTTHYRELSVQLATYITEEGEAAIDSASRQGYLWTNIFQYWPPMKDGPKNSLDAYFAGLDSTGRPICPSQENGGVPLILLMQGPKKLMQVEDTMQERRDLSGFREAGIIPALELVERKMCGDHPGIKIVHRFVGAKNGFIVEAIWDEEAYNERQQKRRARK